MPGNSAAASPSGLRFVQAAFRPMPTNSINLRGRTPAVYGFIFTHVAAHVGSHSLSGDIPAPLITNLDSGSLIRFERLLESLSKRQIS
jgi:hypothetical protein